MVVKKSVFLSPINLVIFFLNHLFKFRFILKVNPKKIAEYVNKCKLSDSLLHYSNNYKRNYKP